MFKENRFVHVSGSEVAQVLNPLSTAEERNSKVFNSVNTASEWNQEQIERASEEVQQPIQGVMKSTRQALSTIFLKIPKKALKTVGAVGTDIATVAAAVPTNLGRWALDLLRLPPRLLVIATDTLSDKTFGALSRTIKHTNQRVHAAMGTTPGFAMAQ